jgi:hypothetical protein
VHGENDDAGLRRAPGHLTRDVETTQSRHQEVEDEDVGVHFVDEIGDLEAVRGLAHHRPRLLLEQ